MDNLSRRNSDFISGQAYFIGPRDKLFGLPNRQKRPNNFIYLDFSRLFFDYQTRCVDYEMLASFLDFTSMDLNRSKLILYETYVVIANQIV